MTKDDDFKLLKIKTCVLKVNIHCDGCKQKVKKLLKRIEGVYQVNIDGENQKVTVSGNVDSETLIKKLVRAGKHAEIWTQKGNQNQKQITNGIEIDMNKNVQTQGLMKGLEEFKNQHQFPTFISDDDCWDDEDADFEDYELQFLNERANQLNLLRQQQQKVVDATNAGKKENPNQNMVTKSSPGGGIDQKMNNVHMGLAGNSNVLGGFQVRPSNGYKGSSTGLVSNGGYPTSPIKIPSKVMMNMNGHHHGSMIMMQNRTPQMMYQRSPYVSSNTGYYYSNYPAQYSYSDPNYSANLGDENGNGCSIM